MTKIENVNLTPYLFNSDLRRPPVMVSALFIVEHAYTHFLNEGLSWRQVLDWMMFSEKHKSEIDWNEFETRIEEFGLSRFYESYFRLGRYLLGEIEDKELTERDMLMMGDIWENYDVVTEDKDFKGKLALVCKLWRARRKYRHFSEISMLHAMWIYAIGYLFVKNPKLN